MAVRMYHCGCVPDEDRFCKLAELQVLRQRQALDGLVGARTEKERVAGQRMEAWTQGWLNEHFALQERLGQYAVIASPSEPHEGFNGDEDPRAWGGNNG